MNISKQDVHRFDRYIKFLGNRNAVIIFAVLMASIGTLLSVVSCEWLWFSRFGSLITVAGLLLTSSPTFDQGIYAASSSAFSFAELDDNGKIMTTTKNDREIGSKIFSGIIVTIGGALIWGFGDLIGRLC